MVDRPIRIDRRTRDRMVQPSHDRFSAHVQRQKRRRGGRSRTRERTTDYCSSDSDRSDHLNDDATRHRLPLPPRLLAAPRPLRAEGLAYDGTKSTCPDVQIQLAAPGHPAPRSGARGPRSTPYSGERRCVTRWCSAYRAPQNRAGANRRTIRGLRPARADAAGSAIPTGKRRFSRECSGPKADSDLRGFDVVWVVNDNCLPSQADLVCPPAFHAYAAAGTFRTSFTSSFQPGAIHGSSSSPDCLHPPHAQKLAPASEPRRRPGRSVSVSASPPLYLPSRGSGRRHSNERIRLRCRDAVR